jgi:hypothetical protein
LTSFWFYLPPSKPKKGRFEGINMSKKSIGKQFLSRSFGVTAAMLFMTLMVLPAISAGANVQPTTVVLDVKAADAPSRVDLATAGDFVILAESGITTTSGTSIIGDIGVSPAAQGSITGFDLLPHEDGNDYVTSSLVDGKIYSPDYAATKMTTAIADKLTAYNDAVGRVTPDFVDLGAAGNIGGLTLVPGLYKWNTAVSIQSDVTISGSTTDVWIFQIAQTLDLSSGMHVILSGGAQAKNIFWQVTTQTTLGTTSVFYGIILSGTDIVLQTGATLNGRALSGTQVTLDAAIVSMPASVVDIGDIVKDPEPVVEEIKDGIDGYPFLGIGVVLLGTVGLIAIIKRKHVSNA